MGAKKPTLLNGSCRRCHEIQDLDKQPSTSCIEDYGGTCLPKGTTLMKYRKQKVETPEEAAARDKSETAARKEAAELERTQAIARLSKAQVAARTFFLPRSDGSSSNAALAADPANPPAPPTSELIEPSAGPAHHSAELSAAPTLHAATIEAASIASPRRSPRAGGEYGAGSRAKLLAEIEALQSQLAAFESKGAADKAAADAAAEKAEAKDKAAAAAEKAEADRKASASSTLAADRAARLDVILEKSAEKNTDLHLPRLLLEAAIRATVAYACDNCQSCAVDEPTAFVSLPLGESERSVADRRDRVMCESASLLVVDWRRFGHTRFKCTCGSETLTVMQDAELKCEKYSCFDLKSVGLTAIAGSDRLLAASPVLTSTSTCHLHLHATSASTCHHPNPNPDPDPYPHPGARLP